MKNILFIASEAVPFIKTGGLADVVGSLPKCFDKQYFDVRVMIPKYLCIKESFRNEMKYVNHFYMDYLGQNRYVGILEYEYEGVTFYFIDNESYFWGDRRDGDWYYDLEKFSFFCKAALSSLPVIGLQAGCHPLPRLADGTYPGASQGQIPRRRVLPGYQVRHDDPQPEVPGGVGCEDNPAFL